MGANSKWLEKYRNEDENGSQKWMITPTYHKLSAIITNFECGTMVENLHNLASQSPSSVAWSIDNNDASNSITVHPNIHESRETKNSWSFTESHERNFFNKFDVKIEAPIKGVQLGVQNTTEWTNNDKSLEETKTDTVDTTVISL
jgi:hypothetical protein